jgi:hypothetical protein
MQVGIVLEYQEEEVVGIDFSQSSMSLCMASGLRSRSTGIIKSLELLALHSKDPR